MSHCHLGSSPPRLQANKPRVNYYRRRWFPVQAASAARAERYCAAMLLQRFDAQERRRQTPTGSQATIYAIGVLRCAARESPPQTYLPFTMAIELQVEGALTVQQASDLQLQAPKDASNACAQPQTLQASRRSPGGLARPVHRRYRGHL